MRTPLTDGEAFRRHVNINTLDDPGCWGWQGAVSPYGYGVVSRRNFNYQAHRFSYELFVGPIERGLTIDHLCRNRTCVNPNHLEMVTSRENTLRGNTITAKNLVKTHCKNGHEFTGDNTYHRPDRPGHRMCKECSRISTKKYLRGKIKCS